MHFSSGHFRPAHFSAKHFLNAFDVLKKVVDRTDAPLGQTQAARKFIRSQFGKKTYNSINAAIKDLERAERKPTKKTVNKALKSINAAFGRDFQPYDEQLITQAENALDEAQMGFVDALARSRKQLETMVLAYEAFLRKEKQEEEALIAVLLLI